MGKPYFAYNNLLPSATVTARTEDPAYPASNLTKHRLWPGWRSADKCLVLNGVDEYAYVADHEDFDITGDLTIECVVNAGSVMEATQQILNKGASSNGYMLVKYGTALRLFLNGLSNYVEISSFFQTDYWYRIKAIYNSSLMEVSIFSAGLEVARANSSIQIGCTLHGSIPSSLMSNTLNLSIGSTNAGAQVWDGKIAYVGIAPAAYDHGGYLALSSCVGYWELDGDLSDSSGYGHTLTGVGIDSSNYQNCTVFQWVWLSGFSGQKDVVFIDRRHNLSEEAVIRLFGDSTPYLMDPTSLRDSATMVAGRPVIFSCDETSSNMWIEIHDPDNPDGYIEIPYIYLGEKASMSRGFLRGYRYSQRRHGNVISDSAGGYTGYARSEQLWEADIRFRALPTDFTVLEKVADKASMMRPIVFSEDGTDSKTRLVYWMDAMTPGFSHIVDTQNFIDLQLKECGGGL